MLSSILPMLCVVFVSYGAISSILTNKIQMGIEGNLSQVLLSLENSIRSLNYVSQQLTFEGSVGRNFDQYLIENDPYESFRLVDAIRTELNLITFTNHSIGFTMYYFDDGRFLFENSPVKSNFSIDDLPMLADYHSITYFGPHVSIDRFNNNYVLSALRRINLPNEQDVYVYIESGFKLTQYILDSSLIGANTFHLILDNSNRVAYSENIEVLAENTYFDGDLNESRGLFGEYYWYKKTSNQGWSVVFLISRGEFNMERDRWIVQVVFMSVIFLMFGLLIGIFMWKMIYIPLMAFDKDIKQIINNNFLHNPIKTKIPEFDYLLDKFGDMKEEILYLLRENERTEKRKADLEIEKLRYQINPHFLLNTLNTAQWLAVIHEQPEIGKYMQALSKLLAYNLEKSGKLAMLMDEINALKEYFYLQNTRYDFTFDICIHAEEQILKTPVPRFILQPLVENAIYHGLIEDGHIQIDIRETEQHAVITVQDNGPGMSQEKISSLFDEENQDKRLGIGIGLNYVQRMIDAFYHGNATLQIESELNHGTVIILTIPLTRKKGALRS